MSHLSVQTKLDIFFKSALLRSERRTSESSIDEYIYIYIAFLWVLNKYS
jgi:hypothetical protein